jgi:hypothetical protein
VRGMDRYWKRHRIMMRLSMTSSHLTQYSKKAQLLDDFRMNPMAWGNKDKNQQIPQISQETWMDFHLVVLPLWLLSPETKEKWHWIWFACDLLFGDFLDDLNGLVRPLILYGFFWEEIHFWQTSKGSVYFFLSSNWSHFSIEERKIIKTTVISIENHH